MRVATSPAGRLEASSSATIQIDESQWFGRLDAEQSFSLGIPDRAGWPFGEIELEAKGGVWWEDAERDVDAFFVETVTVGGLVALGAGFRRPFRSWDPRCSAASIPPAADRSSTSEASREITAQYVDLKATFFEDVDLLAGLRIEQIFIESENDPFTGELQFGDRPADLPDGLPLLRSRRHRPRRASSGT